MDYPQLQGGEEELWASQELERKEGKKSRSGSPLTTNLKPLEFKMATIDSEVASKSLQPIVIAM